MVTKEKTIYFIYLDAFANIGGIEEFNKRFMTSLEQIVQKSDVKVEIISIYDDKGYESNYNNVNFIGFNGNKLKAIWHIIRRVNKQDILFYGHINLLPVAYLTYIVNRVRKTYFIIHGIDVWHRFSPIKRFVLKKFSYLSVSNYTKDIFSEKNNIDPAQIDIFPNCIYLEDDTSIHENPFDPAAFNLLTITRLSKGDNYKGVDNILKAVSLLKNEISNIKYTIVGKGDDTERLRLLVKELDIVEFVDFKGFVADIEPYFSHCDLFALPSKSEGFGIVYLEAMKYKKPVLAANSGGAVDVVIDNITGVLCPYGDIGCLKEKILSIHNNVSFANQIGLKGYRQLIEKFTFTSYKNRLKKILEKYYEKI